MVSQFPISQSYMASTPASFHNIFIPFPSPKHHKYPSVRSQICRDEGNSANIVDGNLSVLRQRIETVRMKEKLKTCFGHEKSGWNYKAGYDDTYKSRVLLVQSLKVAASVGSTLVLVYFGGSIFIFLYSILIHICIHT